MSRFLKNLNAMEKIKLFSDIGVAIFGFLAALFAISSLFLGSKIDSAKKIEEERLKSNIAESNAVAENAKKEAAGANERAYKLELQVERQKERAANAEKDLFVLKEKLKPRGISFTEIDKLVNELKKSSIKEIHISSPLGDSEAALYANQIKYVFESAGWEVDSGIGFSIISGIGAFIFTKNVNNINAKNIVKLFRQHGIKLQEEIVADGSEITIFIGSKNNTD